MCYLIFFCFSIYTNVVSKVDYKQYCDGYFGYGRYLTQLKIVNSGKHIITIYKLEQLDNNKTNDELKICYNLSGESYFENFEIEGKPMFFVGVFKKK